MARLDEETLKKMAEITGGAYVRSVAGDMDLDIIYENQIQDKMTRATMAGGKRRVYQDRFQWFLLPGFLLLALALAMDPRKKAAVVLAAVFIALGTFFTPGKAAAGLVQKGVEAFEQKDFKSAGDFFEQARKKHGDAPEILFNLGDALYHQGKFEDARIQFEKILAGDSDNLKQKAHYNLGNTLFRLDQPQKAMEQYQKALDLDPSDRLAGENLAYVKKWMEKQQQQQQPGDNKDKNQDRQKNQQKNQDQSDKTDSQKRKTGNNRIHPKTSRMNPRIKTTRSKTRPPGSKTRTNNPAAKTRSRIPGSSRPPGRPEPGKGPGKTGPCPRMWPRGS